MITVTFQNDEHSKLAPGLTQWDYGQYLQIGGLDSEMIPEVHFAIRDSSDAIIQAGTYEDNTLIVRIPDVLLADGGDIRAYIYVATLEFGKTVRTVYIPVKPRPKPHDYTAPEEQHILRRLMEDVTGKADDMELVNGALQLLSGDKPVGTRIRLPSGGGGGSGREVELRNNGTAIEWRYTDSNEWTVLVTLDSLRGPRGLPGETPEFEIRDTHLYAIYKE